MIDWTSEFTAEIIKAIKLAHFLGVKQVITTEGDPKTDFGHQLTDDQRLFSIREKLHEPIGWAKTFGIEFLLEPHGILADIVDVREYTPSFALIEDAVRSDALSHLSLMAIKSGLEVVWDPKAYRILAPEQLKPG